MSIALQNQVDDLAKAHIQLAKQLEELNRRLTHLETMRKPGPKPKEHNGHMAPVDDRS